MIDRKFEVPPKSKIFAKTVYDNHTDRIVAGCTVLEHCFYVGIIARAIWRRLAPKVQELIPSCAITLAACHDIGKISPGFLKKIYEALFSSDPDFGQSDPAICSLLNCDSALFESNHAISGLRTFHDLKKTHKEWERVIANHHGGKFNLPLENANNFKFGGKDWQDVRIHLADQLIEKLGPLPPSDIKPNQDQVNMVLALTVFADWLASDERFLKNGQFPKETEMEQNAEDILNDIEWISSKPCQESCSFADLFGNGFIPNEVQRQFFEIANEPGIFIIEAPMGLGKTEAALWGALRLIQKGYHRGIYFALPTRTTSDKIHERMEVFLDRAFEDKPGVRLIHGSAWMRLPILTKQGFQKKEKRDPNSLKKIENDRDVGSLWYQSSKRGLLQPFAAGTVDQALLGMIPFVKHAFLRLFGLAGKVVILDEVHSYDIYTGTILDKLVQKLAKLGASVIILSATLTRERRNKLLSEFKDDKKEIYTDWRKQAQKNTVQNFSDKVILPDSTDPYPLISCRYHSGKTIHVNTKPLPDRVVYISHMEQGDPNLPSIIAKRAVSGEMILCILNTVDKAQSFYKKIKSELKDNFPLERIGLLHSRFPLWRREELENKWLGIYGKNGDRTCGAILVATQIVEQSVDIDADLIISDLAPTDMLLQRLGRLWRHSQKRKATKPEMIILHPPKGDNSYLERLGADAWVYSPYVLARSDEEWRKRDFIALPSEIRTILEATYQDRSENIEELQNLYNRMVEKRKTMEMKADSATRDQGLPVESADNCMTRYSDTPSLDLVLIKEVSDSGKKRCITLSDETTPDLVSKIRIGRSAVDIRRNTLSIRKNHRYPIDLTDHALDPILGQYFFSEYVPLFIDEETRRLKTLTGIETPYSYTNELGVFIEQQFNNHLKHDPLGYTLSEDNENECPEEFEW
ncbi:MAG: CRISPR-associated helicase Cas3' [Planctomycetia bacterium]|nr:CRISPR-associated helicase Cas3' [Planctomycetia bacterium]